jgi:hypothetical protein
MAMRALARASYDQAKRAEYLRHVLDVEDEADVEHFSDAEHATDPDLPTARAYASGDEAGPPVI